MTGRFGDCGCGGPQKQVSGFRGLGWGAFGALAPPGVVLSVLHDVYNTAISYMNDTVYAATGSTGPVALTDNTSLWGLQYAATQLDWNNGTGSQVAGGSFDWSTYRDQLNGFIQSILQVRQDANLDTTAMTTWYVNTATPALANISIAAPVGQLANNLGTTVGAGAQGLANALPWWVWAGGAVLLGTFLLSEGNTFLGRRTAPATAGYAGLRRRRGHKKARR